MKKNKKYILDLFLSKNLYFRDIEKTLKWLNDRYGEISLREYAYMGEKGYLVDRLNLGCIGTIKEIRK